MSNKRHCSPLGYKTTLSLQANIEYTNLLSFGELLLRHTNLYNLRFFICSRHVIYIYIGLQKCVAWSTDHQFCFEHSPNYMIFKKDRGTIMI